VAEVAVLVLAAGAVGVIGVAIGMIVAPAFTRWFERESEDADGEQ
jgi:hypothetical protein